MFIVTRSHAAVAILLLYPVVVLSTPRLKWNFTSPPLSSPHEDYITSTPALSLDGNTLYFGAWDHNLYALHSNNGTLKWNVTLNLGSPSSPTVGNDGTIYVGSLDSLYAVHANGTLKFRYDTNSSFWDVETPPTVGKDGAVYFGSDDGYFYAVHGNNGTLKWKDYVGSSVSAKPALDMSESTLYFNSHNNKLYAVNMDGSLKWQFPMVNATGIDSDSFPTVATDGTIYVGEEHTSGFNLFALDSHGALIWQFDTGGPIPAKVTLSRDETTLYFGSFLDVPGQPIDNGTLYAIDSNGKEKWRYITSSPFRGKPQLFEDKIYYLNDVEGSVLYALNSTNGKYLWEYEISDGPQGDVSPTIGKDGNVMYFAASGSSMIAVSL